MTGPKVMAAPDAGKGSPAFDSFSQITRGKAPRGVAGLGLRLGRLKIYIN